MTRWQHVVPQGTDEMHEEEILPDLPLGHGKTVRCLECGEPIKKVDENEGPEMLKAMFRF